MTWHIIEADCVKAMAAMGEASVDAIVTDPPYHLVFMGRAWDYAPSPAESQAQHRRWADEALRVLKPGGHLLAFGGTRTSHRLACAIEDAGFEIRDTICWLYGSGFPKSLDVSKAIDRQRLDNPDWQRVGAWLRARRLEAGVSAKGLCAAIGAHGEVNHGGAVSNWENGFSCPTWDQWEAIREALSFGTEMDAEVWRLNGRKGTPGNERSDRVVSEPGGNAIFQPTQRVLNGGTPVLSEAERWQGWGTALKPAHEPIVVARKPIVGTIAQTVLEHGTGALNVDATRTVPTSLGAARSTSGDSTACTCRELEDARGNRNGSTSRQGTSTEPHAQHERPRPNECACAQPWTGRQGSLAGCPACRRSDDEPSRLDEGADPGAVRRHADALESLDRQPASSDTPTSQSMPCPHCTALDVETPLGRWPANVVLDERAAATLDESVGPRSSGSRVEGVRSGLGYHGADGDGGPAIEGSTGPVSRFFYCAKASSAERSAGLDGKIGGCRCHEANTEDSPPRATDEPTGADEPRWSTSGSGSKPTDPSPTASKSTIETSTSRTTISPTSSSSLPPTTSGFTPRTTAATMPETGSDAATLAASGSHPRLSTTTSAEKAGPSMADADRATSHESSKPSSSAVCADCGGVVEGAWQNTHPLEPTVKPIALMRWLVRLVTPPGGLVLDPFTGSGTTGCAAVLEGFGFVGIERETEYAEIARARIAWWAEHPEGVELVDRLDAERSRRAVADAGQLQMFGQVA